MRTVSSCAISPSGAGGASSRHDRGAGRTIVHPAAPAALGFGRWTRRKTRVYSETPKTTFVYHLHLAGPTSARAGRRARVVRPSAPPGPRSYLIPTTDTSGAHGQRPLTGCDERWGRQ